MSIESYQITDSSIQASGIQRVRVAFTDHLDRVHNRGFDFPADAVIDDEVEVRISNIEKGLKDREIDKVIKIIDGGGLMPDLEYATVAEVEQAIADREAE